MQHLAIFGGTFDPIHNGHLQISLNIQAYFKFDSYIFLPCKIQLIKPAAQANDQQRIKMIELAIKKYSDFKLDLREIKRDSPSYMVDTLSSFRLEFPKASITLIIGYDAFIALPYWYQWHKLISLANILVINRNEFASHPMPKIMNKFIAKFQSKDKLKFLNEPSGSVFLFDAGHYKISSTAIREEIKKKKDISGELPEDVFKYLKDAGLYQ